MSRYDRGYAAIDLDAIEHNLQETKRVISKETKIIGVIKTNGYGHGAVQIAEMMEAMDFIWGYAVATPEEAMHLRDAGMKKPILILGFVFPYAYEEMIQNDIRFTVFDQKTLDDIAMAANQLHKKAYVHIKIDTGMSRIGIFPDSEGASFVSYACGKQNINLEGIFTHFACADEKGEEITNQQIKIFTDFVELAEKENHVTIPLKHCSNSAGIIGYPEANLNLVREGITIYGLWPSEEVSKEVIHLMPAMSLLSKVAFVKEVPEGTAISYGGTYVTKRKSIIATIPLGYGDGYSRGLSNKGTVLIHGKRAEIVGRICMDQFMIDVTDIPDVKAGDVVTLIGKDGNECITMEELGEISGRFNYEFACNLTERIPRRYWRHNQEIK